MSLDAKINTPTLFSDNLLYLKIRVIRLNQPKDINRILINYPWIYIQIATQTQFAIRNSNMIIAHIYSKT